MSVLQPILAKAVEMDASDVHITHNQQPIFRVHGELTDSGFEKATSEDLVNIVSNIIPPHVTEVYAKEHEADF